MRGSYDGGFRRPETVCTALLGDGCAGLTTAYLLELVA